VWFIDENLLGVAKALAILRDDVTFPGRPGCPIARHCRDEDWLQEVGDRGWNVIMRDKNIRKRKPEMDQLIRHGVKAFCLTTSGNLNKWDIATVLVPQWAEMTRIGEGSGPFLYAVTRGGLREIFLASS
jgi:hypothetical protein